MEKQPLRLLVTVLLIGWSFDVLFWKIPIGLNFPIFLCICLIGGFALLWSLRLRPDWKSLVLLLPTLFFAFATILRQEPLSLFLAFLFSLASLGLLAATYQEGRWLLYGPIDYVWQSMLLSASLIYRPILYFIKAYEEKAKEPKEERKTNIGPVVRGLLIAAPIVGVFVSLLASADAVFNQTIRGIFTSLSFDHLDEILVQILLILVIGYGEAGAFLHAAEKGREAALIGEAKPLFRPFLGFIETGIVFSSVILVFLLFVAIQFRYFFGGQNNIGLAGYTYSEYARRGFNELVVVAVLSLLLTITLSLITRLGGSREKRVFTGLSVALVCEVLVILVSAYQRLGLAIDWHGYSRLRLYPRVFMVWLGLLFIAVVVLEIVNRKRLFTFAIAFTSLGFAASLILINVDAAIVDYNVQRAAQGKHFNVGMLSSLSADAVPALASSFQNKALPQSVHEGIGAALVCYQHTRDYPLYQPSDWRMFNAATQNAAIAIQANKKELAAYLVNDDGNLIRVHTPGNVWYECLDNPCADSSYCD